MTNEHSFKSRGFTRKDKGFEHPSGIRWQWIKNRWVVFDQNGNRFNFINISKSIKLIDLMLSKLK